MRFTFEVVSVLAHDGNDNMYLDGFKAICRDGNLNTVYGHGTVFYNKDEAVRCVEYYKREFNPENLQWDWREINAI